MYILPEDIIKLLMAVVVGGMIGAEREYRDKAAGFRTIIFICVGSTLFTMYSSSLGGPDDPVRIAANIVSGVGFLGAGVILRGNAGVVGLTTAAIIWVSAALGMGIGGGEYAMVGIAVAAVLLVLWFFPKIEAWIHGISHSAIYEVTGKISEEHYHVIEDVFRESGLKVRRLGREKRSGKMVSRWQISGKPDAHENVLRKLLAHPDVEEFVSR
jgi:putative Mg2+ transporter-C (MgtC) family protein